MKNDVIISPLNYIGNKKKLLKQILPLFPSNIKTFLDLFCGGCTVGLNVKSDKVVFNDIITHLIDMYQIFLNSSEEEVLQFVEERIKELNLSKTNLEGYLKLRTDYNKTRNPLDLFVLIAYSFNHQIRFNSSHEYNNPFGRERSSFNPKMKENLKSFLSALHTRDVSFTNLDFRYFDFSNLSEDDFVYADPPYLISTGSYNDGKRGFTGWSNAEELALLKILKELDNRGIKFALSNVLRHKGLENNLLKDWIEDNGFYIHFLNMSYDNSNYQTKRSDEATLEVLITNYNTNELRDNEKTA